MLSKLKISTKIIMTVTGVSLIGLLLSIYSIMQMSRIDDEYSYLLSQRSAAIIQVTRANRMVNQAAYAAYKTMAYDGQSQEAKGASADISKDLDGARTTMAEAASKLQDAKPDFDKLAAVLEQISSKALEGAALGIQNQNDEARAALSAMDSSVAKYVQEAVALVDRLKADNAARSTDLSNNVGSTIMLTLIGTVAGLAIGIGGALLVSSRGITGPLNLLAQRMKELSSGRVDTPVEGTDRGDEVGAMARAVQIFKDAAIEKQHADAEA
ncbi:HAMP domain-containing protein, partial [Mangrovicella endophytica]|uniref:HAMP domain-containing protein n=1 Tax=Mangrovicella endophytica TaxID=2066697 RepID=UPI000DF40B17